MNKHVFSKTRLRQTWYDMKRRCYDTSRKRYEYYGGKGITVCEEWKNSFIAFRKWALSNGYQDGLQIDRIDSNGNYCPENCRWVTPHQNKMNKTSNTGISRYKGVGLSHINQDGQKRWRAYIRFKGVRTHLGTFNSEEKAALAYNKKAVELFGKFALLNEVGDNK